MANKKGSRKGKRARRGTRRCRMQMGGWKTFSPAGVNEKTMMSPSSQSLAQGQDYDKIHSAQHGGAYTPMSGAPIGTTGVLDASLRTTARLPDLDASFTEIQGMSDQSGGGYKRRNRGSKRGKRGSKSRRCKSRRSKRRTMYGGAGNMNPAGFNAPTMLMPPNMESKALMAMNPEWKLAANPTSFAPNLAK